FLLAARHHPHAVPEDLELALVMLGVVVVAGGDAGLELAKRHPSLVVRGCLRPLHMPSSSRCVASWSALALRPVALALHCTQWLASPAPFVRRRTSYAPSVAAGWCRLAGWGIVAPIGTVVRGIPGVSAEERRAMPERDSKDWEVSPRAAELHRSALVWDDHGGFAYSTAAALQDLERWHASGLDSLSLHVGY